MYVCTDTCDQKQAEEKGKPKGAGTWLGKMGEEAKGKKVESARTEAA